MSDEKLAAWSNPAMFRVTMPHDGMTPDEIRQLRIDDWNHNHPFATETPFEERLAQHGGP